MMRIITLLIASMLVGCGNGGTAEPTPPTSPPPPPPAEVVFTFDISEIPIGNGALGTIFEFTSADGEVKCGAGFISTVSTRIFNNQNSLEFSCRESASVSPLEWVLRDPPVPGYPTAQFGNVTGILYAFDEGRWQQPDGFHWDESLAPGMPAHRGVARVYREDSYRWVLSSSESDCKGFSIFGPRGYHGTVPTDVSTGASIIWRGVVYLNHQNKLWRTDVPEEPVATNCEMLPLTLLSDEPMLVYAMYPVGNTLWIGGGGAPFLADQKYDCAPLYATDGVEVEIVELTGCESLQVTEIYSFMLSGDALYAGTYPDGYLYRIDFDERLAVRSSYPELPAGTWTEDGRRYLESQALGIARGIPIIGMFPWGEIYELGPTQRTYRLFTGPEKTPNARRPFADDMDNNWSQRITSIVTRNGEVCAGTGNTFAERYDPVAHSFIGEALAAQYGALHCAALSHQLLGTYGPRTAATFSFAVTADSMSLTMDNLLLASREQGLSDAARAALVSDNGTLTIGSGVYGPAQMTITQR